MSSSEILTELSKLSSEDRQKVFERLCELQEADLLRGVGPTEEEMKILDEALAEYERDGDVGRPWREVMAELHRPRRQ